MEVKFMGEALHCRPYMQNSAETSYTFKESLLHMRVGQN